MAQLSNAIIFEESGGHVDLNIVLSPYRIGAISQWNSC